MSRPPCENCNCARNYSEEARKAAQQLRERVQQQLDAGEFTDD